MGYCEVLHFGTHPDNPGGAGGILARSGGITKEVAEEIGRLCHGWNSEPVAADLERALLAFPLKGRLSGTPRGAYAVIRVTTDPRPRFQVLVLDRSDYRALGYNPYAVDAAGLFPIWDPDSLPNRVKIQDSQGGLVLSPPPSPDDVGLVDEALHHLLASRKLYLPIDEPEARSDRALALIIEILPEAMKQQLRFASYAPSPANGYHLAATATDGCDMHGWQRLMMTLVPGELPEKLQEYVKKVRECLAYGDISSLRDQQRLLTLDKGSEPAARPSKVVARPKAVPAAASTPPPMAVPLRLGGKVPAPAARPDRPEYRSAPRTAHWRGGRRQVPGPVVALLLLVLTAGSGWTYFHFFQEGEGLSWSGLLAPFQGSGSAAEHGVPSLLEVTRVADVYDRQLRGIKRADMIPGLNLEGDGAERLENLSREAGEPLLAQVDLFRKLAAAGIRQGSRPDRELERMRALTHQSEMLDVECQRLVLAWHSLASRVLWQDLAGLSDDQVRSRRDSLASAAPGPYQTAVKALGLDTRPEDLTRLRKQTRGMAQLLELFMEKSYSEEWAEKLYRAAEKVTPTASPTTRAYRNSAFALVRLKDREHGTFFATGAYAPDWETGRWLPVQVQDVLPDLRRAAGSFAPGEAPPILAGTLALYSRLERAGEMVEDLVEGRRDLEEWHRNQAVLFDAETYAPYLRRIQHEAVARRLARGMDTATLVDGETSSRIAAFEETRQRTDGPEAWLAAAARQTDLFLAGWAHHQAEVASDRRTAALQHFQSLEQAARDEGAQLDRLARLGQDWSESWRRLDSLLQEALAAGEKLDNGQGTPGLPPLAALARWRDDLRQPADLILTRATIRLDQERLSGPRSLRLEILVPDTGETAGSAEFRMGPAAPAGSGWVGTVALDQGVALNPVQDLRLRVLSDDGREEILVVDYPSLAAGGGPGNLVRPRRGEGGSILAHPDPRWWEAATGLGAGGPAGI